MDRSVTCLVSSLSDASIIESVRSAPSCPFHPIPVIRIFVVPFAFWEKISSTSGGLKDSEPFCELLSKAFFPAKAQPEITKTRNIQKIARFQEDDFV